MLLGKRRGAGTQAVRIRGWSMGCDIGQVGR